MKCHCLSSFTVSLKERYFLFDIVLFTFNYAAEVNAKPDVVIYQIYKSGRLVPVEFTKKKLGKVFGANRPPNPIPYELAPPKEGIIMSLPSPTPVSAGRDSLFAAFQDKINSKVIPPTPVTTENSLPFRRKKRDSEGGFERVIIMRHLERNMTHELKTTSPKQTDAEFFNHHVLSEAENDKIEPGKSLFDNSKQDMGDMSIEVKPYETFSLPNYIEEENFKDVPTTVSTLEQIDKEESYIPRSEIQIHPSYNDSKLEFNQSNTEETHEEKKPMLIDVTPLETKENHKVESQKDKNHNEEIHREENHKVENHKVENHKEENHKEELTIQEAADINLVVINSTTELTTNLITESQPQPQESVIIANQSNPLVSDSGNETIDRSRTVDLIPVATTPSEIIFRLTSIFTTPDYIEGGAS